MQHTKQAHDLQDVETCFSFERVLANLERLPESRLPDLFDAIDRGSAAQSSRTRLDAAERYLNLLPPLCAQQFPTLVAELGTVVAAAKAENYPSAEVRIAELLCQVIEFRFKALPMARDAHRTLRQRKMGGQMTAKLTGAALLVAQQHCAKLHATRPSQSDTYIASVIIGYMKKAYPNHIVGKDRMRTLVHQWRQKAA